MLRSLCCLQITQMAHNGYKNSPKKKKKSHTENHDCVCIQSRTPAIHNTNPSDLSLRRTSTHAFKFRGRKSNRFPIRPILSNRTELGILKEVTVGVKVAGASGTREVRAASLRTWRLLGSSAGAPSCGTVCY